MALIHEKKFYLFNDKKEYDATMVVEDAGATNNYIVKAGSKVRTTIANSFSGHSYYSKFTDNLKNVENGILKTDYNSTSPSLAATIVLGRAANGRTEWKDENNKELVEYLDLDSDSEINFTSWFVGSYIGDKDYTNEFVEQGIWKHGFKKEKYIHYFEQIEIGDKIAIKAAYNKKVGLPFNNNENSVSVLAIKARGTITGIDIYNNTIFVDWDKKFKQKEWYFYTFRKTMWKVETSNSWRSKALYDFAFNDISQEYSKFMNDPYWKGRYSISEEYKYDWIRFYTEFASKLLEFKDNRIKLLSIIKSVFDENSMKYPLTEKNKEGIVNNLTDVCPFTVFGLFNKGLTNSNRIKIANGIAKAIGVSEKLESEFLGIPVLNNMMSRFFAYSWERREEDIDNLWQLFEYSLMRAKDNSDEFNIEFTQYFDKVLSQPCVKWNITFALYWISPYDYLPLDSNTRNSLLSLEIDTTKMFKGDVCSGNEYLVLIDKMLNKFANRDYPTHSFPELSYKAWNGDFDQGQIKVIEPNNEDIFEVEIIDEKQYEEYTVDEFLKEVFISKEEHTTLSSLLNRKKNVILQGAPGVGKTFMAKRLAYSLLGFKKEDNIQFVQFHQSYSYEDFIMGYRPTSYGGFEIKTGPFYNFCQKARLNPTENFYFIIDEINRGNLSKIFGELMMLIEGDKRGQSLKLIYEDVEFSVPSNLYIIGMMNTADRSLAIIDYALRRRFCFYDVEPAFDNETFKTYLIDKGANEKLVENIRLKLVNLNSKISEDINLGKGFRIGHSYFCDYYENTNWYEEVVCYEIKPLLEEYWFDDEDKVLDYLKDLLD